jgi:eukaryotic-like serine/threonine-protein kinase
MQEQRKALDQAKKERKIRRRKYWLIAGAVAVILILLFSLLNFTDLLIRVKKDTASQPQTNEWTMFRHDLQHTGSTGANGAAPAGELKWTFTAGSAIHSSPAVADGVVYVGSRDSHLYALDAETGRQIWAFQAGSWVDSSPVVVNGVVFFGSNDSYVYAVDAKTGAKIWSYKTPYAVRSSPAVADGVVYVGSDDYFVYALDAINGNLLWKSETDDNVISSPSVYGGVVTIGSGDKLLYTFNAKNGRSRLQFLTTGNIFSSPAIKDGVAYFSDTSGFFYAIDTSKKNWLWENKIRYYWNALYIYGVAPKPSNPSGYLWSMSLGWNIRSASSTAVTDTNAYLGAQNDMVCIDLATHKTAWTFATGDLVTSSPAVGGSAVFFGGYNGHVYALNSATGEKLWEYTTGDQITSSPALDGGVLYVGSHDGNLYAFK